MDQADAAVFAENAARFKEETDALLQEAAQLNLPEGTEAEVFHEGFAYFAELFGMEIASGYFCGRISSAFCEGADRSGGRGEGTIRYNSF